MGDDGLVAAEQRVATVEARIDVLLREFDECRTDAVSRVDGLIDATDELIRARRALLELRQVVAERPRRRLVLLALAVQPVVALAVLVSVLAGPVSWNVGVVALFLQAGFVLWLLLTREVAPSWRHCAVASMTAAAFMVTALAAVRVMTLWWVVVTVSVWFAGAAWLHEHTHHRVKAGIRRGP